MHAVSDAEVAARLKHHENILSLNATPEEVEEWYFAVDPIDETHRLMTESMLMREDDHGLRTLLQDEFERFVLHVRGGTTLLASRVYPEVFDEGIESWHQELSRIYGTETNAQENGRLLGTSAILDLIAERLREMPTTYNQAALPRLMISAEMLRSGAANILKVLLHPGATIDNKEGSKIEDIIYTSGAMSETLLRYLSLYGLQETDPVTGGAITDETRMLSLRAGTLIASSWMGEARSRQDEEHAEKAELEFLTLVEMMQVMFDSPELGMQQKLKTAAVKGPLHETLWALDAYVLRKMHPEKFSNILVVPAYSCGDAPRIGHPELRRGYDFLVHDTELNTRDYIQLKAGNGGSINKKPYHPAIWELREPNFMEVNPRRLSRKLQVYKEWAESGFDSVHNEAVSKYIMKSTTWELNNIAHDKLDRVTALRRFFMEHFIGPNIHKEQLAEAAKRNAHPLIKPKMPNIKL
jgi:hypothetical protein